MLQFRYAAESNTGRVRENNEDAGFVGPYLLGWVLDTTHSFAAGLVVIGAILIAGGALVLRARD